MKLNLSRLEDYEDDFLDDDETVIRKFPRENKSAINNKKEAVRQARKAKMNARAQEEKSSFLGEADQFCSPFLFSQTAASSPWYNIITERERKRL